MHILSLKIEVSDLQRHTISVGSVTYAIKGRDLLRKMGIKAYIERKTNTNGNVGCGYVIIAEGNRNKIISLLNDYKIKIIGISSN